MTTVIEERFAAAVPEAVHRLVRACSPRSLQRRFFLPAPVDPETAWSRYARYLLAGPPRGTAIVASVGAMPVGLLNLVVTGDREVEASLLVADARQRSGVATRLLAVELGQPRWDGWTVQAVVEPDNPGARALLRRQQLGSCRQVGRDRFTLDFAVALRVGARPKEA